MKKVFSLSVIMIMALALIGCSGSAKADPQTGTVYVEVEYVPQYSFAPAKYDTALRQAHRINQELTKAEFYLDNFTDNLQEIAGDVIDVAEMGVKEALQEYYDYLVDQGITIGVRTYISEGYSYFEVYLIEPDTVSAEMQESLNDFEDMIKSIPAFVDSLTEVVETSTELAGTLSSMVTSLDTDFTGLNVTKIPAATKALTSTATQLAEVPDRVSTLIEQAKETMEAILEVMGGDA